MDQNTRKAIMSPEDVAELDGLIRMMEAETNQKKLYAQVFSPDVDRETLLRRFALMPKFCFCYLFKKIMLSKEERRRFATPSFYESLYKELNLA